MEYIKYKVNIVLRKNIEYDFCRLSQDLTDDVIILDVYTSGKNPINFKKTRFFSIADEDICGDFIPYFTTGRNVLSSAGRITIIHDEKNGRNTKQQNKEITKLIRVNNLNKTLLYVDIGDIGLSREDIDSLEPFNSNYNVLIPFNNYQVTQTPDLVRSLFDITNEIIKRTNLHSDFSLMEKVLYAYDMIKTDFMVDSEYAKKMENILSNYVEPSYFYSMVFSHVLIGFGINVINTTGEFYRTGTNAMNIARINDPEYDIDGIFYFDLSRDSRQSFLNNLVDYPPEKINEAVVDSYYGFCKNKEFMISRSGLDKDYGVGPYCKDFMMLYDATVQKRGLNGIYSLAAILNSAGYLVDGTTVVDIYHGLSKEKDDIDEIREKAERYAKLFGAEIDGADFLEMLFNVRKEEYCEDKRLFHLSTDVLRDCVFRSKFYFPGMNIGFLEETEEPQEQENITAAIIDEFDTHFENAADNKRLDERIKELKMALTNKEKDKPNNDNK